jgi:hypothetical protein
MADRTEVVERAERVLGEIEAAQGRLGTTSTAPVEEDIAVRLDRHVRARGKRRASGGIDYRRMLVAGTPLFIVIGVCVALVFITSNDTVKIIFGVVAGVLMLVLGVISGLAFAAVEKVPVADIDLILKDAEAVIKDLVGIVSGGS